MFLGVAYAPWMASFTETVEKRNPALAATGLAIWGLVIRIVIAISVFIVPHVVNTVSTLVEKGPVAQQIVAAHPAEIEAAQKLDPATSAALAKDPTDQAAGIKAISEITGISVKDVTTVATLSATHADALEAASAIDLTTAGTLLQDPTNQAAIAKAIGEVTSKLGITQTEAVTRLQDLATIPKDQLLLAQSDGQQIKDATTTLTNLGKIPASDLAILQDASKAAADSPKQWQHYFWIAVGGEVVFIPLIFLLAGFWSPKRARRSRARARGVRRVPSWRSSRH